MEVVKGIVFVCGCMKMTNRVVCYHVKTKNKKETLLVLKALKNSFRHDFKILFSYSNNNFIQFHDRSS